jgi:hypothetical protein
MGRQVMKSCPSYRDGREVKYGFIPGSTFFRLVVSSLPSGVVEPYPVWGA